MTAVGPSRARLIGDYGGRESGPLLLVTAAIHGNELAGVHALDRVFATLERERPALRGRIAGLIGNRAAAVQGVRYVDADLNRIWAPAELENLRHEDPDAERGERHEQRELIAAIDAQLMHPHDKVVHLDLHSTSSEGPPFTIAHPDPSSCRLAAALGAPVIFGILRDVTGTMLGWSAARGFDAVVFEGGQNLSPATIDHQESAVWLAMQAEGMLVDAAGAAGHRQRLARSVANMPDAVEVCFRYAIDADEHFTMLPGFKSFQRVHAGQLLALGGRSGTEEIRCPIGAILLMPRYQEQGRDGFFLARAVDLVA
jgi:succinylglutamate desuccinylase